MIIELEPQTRTEGIGASDAAGILGLDDWNPPIRVWRRLRGEALPDTSGEAAEWGQILEPVVLGRYAVKTQSLVLQPITSWVHRDHEWLHATPDGVIAEQGPTVIPRVNSDILANRVPFALANGAGLVQAKTASAYLAHEWADGKAPRKYVVQVQVEMAVTGAPWCDLAVLIGGNDFRVVRVESNREQQDAIIKALATFHSMVRDGIEPAPDGSDAHRQYAISKMAASDAVLRGRADLDAYAERWRAIRNEQERLKAEAEAIKTRLLLELSAAGATKLETPSGVIAAYKRAGGSAWKEAAAGYAKRLGEEPRAAQGAPTWTIRAPRAWGGDE